MLDEMEIAHTADQNYKITFGEYIEKLLSDKQYFNTVLPRIPILIEREIQKKLLAVPDKRARKSENSQKSHMFRKGLILYVLSKKDNQWHRARVTGIHWKDVQFKESADGQIEDYQLKEDFF